MRQSLNGCACQSRHNGRFECWLWEDDHSTAAAITELLDGYAEHDIPARTVILDAPWSTRYNDFHFDTAPIPSQRSSSARSSSVACA